MIFDLNSLMDRLSSATYKVKSYSGNNYYDKNLIDFDALPAVRMIIAQAVEEMSIQMAELEAKCFAYEAIISNSNFKPVLEKKIITKEDGR